MWAIILWFPKGKKENTRKFKRLWFGLYKIQYCFLGLFINIDKFEPNLILVNINKFKPYKYLRKVPRGLEATIKGGGDNKEDLEHKEDSKHKKDSQKGFNMVLSKIIKLH